MKDVEGTEVAPNPRDDDFAIGRLYGVVESFGDDGSEWVGCEGSVAGNDLGGGGCGGLEEALGVCYRCQ